MKKIKQTVAITGALLMLSIGAFSQTSASKTEKIKTLLELTGSANLGEQILDQMMTAFNSSPTKISEKFWKSFREEIDIDGLFKQIIPIYAKHFTEADIDGLIAFYKSDVGKKVTTTLPVIMKESMQLGQEWGKEIGEKVVKKLKEEQEKEKE